MEGATAAALWGAVVLSGVYHGLNPGMGWPLAVSSALMERRRGALWRAIGALALGHGVAMLAILMPFAALATLAAWEREVRLAAALIVLGLGLWLLIDPRHPRLLARVPPHRLALWSFLVAVAHGAALMVLPAYLALCAPGTATADWLDGGAGALVVSAVHTGAMALAGGAAAYAVHRWLGLGAIRRGWLNLDRIWALSLVVVGAVAGLSAV